MDATGTRLGRWELGREIGRGAMGTVHAAWGPAGEAAAVKLVDRPVDLVDEVWAMSQLDHRSIVALLDAGRVTPLEAKQVDGLRAGAPWLAMERGDGPLDGLRMPRDWGGLAGLLRGLLDALAHAHARQVVHRDLKPRNVLWFADGADGRWKLGDFGIAHALSRHDPDDRMNRSAGTPTYMSPEQLAGRWRDLGPWTDLYALGCLGWHVATGEPPFPGTDVPLVLDGHLKGALPSFEPLFAVPDGLGEWLARLLEKRPADRYVRAADARRALDALEGIAAGPVLPPRWGPEVAGGPPSPKRLPPLVGRHAERDRLWQALAAVEAERCPRAVVLAGPAGSGRSRLARWLQERAHEVGAGWILEAPHAPDGGPTTGLAYMLASFLRSVGMTRAELVPRLTEILADEGFPDPTLARAAATFIAEDGLTRGERFRLLLASLAVATRAVPGNARSPGRVATLLLDDLQWGDEALAFARFLLRPENRWLPVLALCTVDPAQADERITRHLAALREEGAEWIALADDLPASPFGDELVGLGPAEPTLESTDRDPEAAASATWEAPADGWDRRIEDALGEDRADRDALEVAAALGLRLDRGELEEALRQAGVAPSPRWPAALVDGGLLVPLGRVPGGLAFAHPQVAEAVAARAMDSGRWSAWNGVVGRVLDGRGAPPDRIARHLLAAGEVAAAAAKLAEATRAALERGDPHRARALLAQCDAALDRLGAPADDRRRREAASLRDAAARATATG